jgi:predicted site-specific integrase-resolvase
MHNTTHRAIGYIRVSTDKQEIGPEVQAESLITWAASQDTEIDLRREDAASAKSLKGRPILARALADLKAGRADVLVVSKLDRLSRSVADFARILEDAEHQGWSVVCLDLAVDTRTVTGRAMAHVVATFAQMERERIGERTRPRLPQPDQLHRQITPRDRRLQTPTTPSIVMSPERPPNSRPGPTQWNVATPSSERCNSIVGSNIATVPTAPGAGRRY